MIIQYLIVNGNGKNKSTLILLDSRPNTYIPITKLTNSEFNYQYLDGTFTNTLFGFSGITSYECIKLNITKFGIL